MTIQVRSAFDEAATLYEAAANGWSRSAESLRDEQARLRTAQQALADNEIDIKSNNEFDGKNAETREVQFRKLASEDDRYGFALLEVENARQAVQRWTDECSTHRDMMALRKRQMDWAIAYIHFQTEKGGEGNDNRN